MNIQNITSSDLIQDKVFIDELNKVIEAVRLNSIEENESFIESFFEKNLDKLNHAQTVSILGYLIEINPKSWSPALRQFSFGYFKQFGFFKQELESMNKL